MMFTIRLAEHAVREMVAGRPVHTHDLVVSLRNFIREALDLAPIPADLMIPQQGPARPSAPAARGKNERGNDTSGGGGKVAAEAWAVVAWGGGSGGGDGIATDDPSDPASGHRP